MPAKKKLTKKEKARIDAEQAELLRIEMEKEKLRKQEEERERKLREREEAEKRQQQEIAENKIRRNQLKASMEYFDQINTIIDAIKLKTKEQVEWNEYMRCDGLPNAHNPGEIRRHIHMWRIYISERNNLERNWLLKTDERTLLTHDPDIHDLSRSTLRAQQGNLGDIYAHKISEILGILNEMDEALKSKSISISTIMDLQRLKLDIRRQLRNYIDDFTFKILIHIERDMEPIKLGISKHDYISDVFKSLILAMQGDISTKKDKIKVDEQPQHTEIEFPLLELQLSLPPAVKISNSAIRGLWLNYDHFSDNCCSFYLPRVKTNKLNILQQSKKEWKKRKEIILTTLEEQTKVIEPDTLFDTEEEQEPAPIDVDKIYSEYEDEINKLRRHSIGADALNLTEYEINLRRYRIVGGVYCIDYLEQPQQDKRINSRTFIRTIVSPDKIKPQKFYQAYKPPPPPLPGVRRLPEEIEAEMRMMERNLDKLAMVSLQLTSKVLWLEPPVVCRWETQAEFEESEIVVPIVPDSRTPSATTTTNTPPGSTIQSPRKSCGSLIPHVKKFSSADIKSIESRKPSTKTTSDGSISINNFPLKEITDFDLSNVPPKLDFYGLIVDFIIPRLPDGYCIKIKSDNFREYKRRYVYFAKIYDLDEESKIELNLKKANIEKELSRSIIENLDATDSPRPFYPRINFKKVLRVKQSEIEYKIDDNQSGECLPVKRGYMFSQLLEDLDQICESNSPVLQQKIVEINSKLSSPTDSLPTSPVRKFSGFIIMRETDIPDKTIEKESADTESLSEYEEEEEEISEEQIDTGKMVKHELGRWSVRDVHDAKFNEDKFTIQFRTGRLGFFGFAMNRYSNMPYQTWEIKPDIKMPDAVSFNLTAAVISIEMTITKDGYCVNTIQGGTTEAINQLIGKTVLLQEMKSVLQSAAVDIFPELDAFCYTEGSCEKNYVMEMHLYKCMSTLALSHNFSWSRWNLLSGSRVAVLLMRELLDNKKVPNHSTLYVTPLKASVVDCTEVSASFTTIGVQGMEYYADLHQLTLVHAHPLSKEKQNNLDPVLRENVDQILMATRPLSFC